MLPYIDRFCTFKRNNGSSQCSQGFCSYEPDKIVIFKLVKLNKAALTSQSLGNLASCYIITYVAA